MLKGMENWELGVWIAHGEGRLEIVDSGKSSWVSRKLKRVPLFFSYQAKIVFQKLFRTFLKIELSSLEAEIHRFFMLQLSWYTL